MKYIFTLLSFSLIMLLSIEVKADNKDIHSSAIDSSSIASILLEIAALEDDHCEVPCGVYGDSLRIALISEHIRTVEKASVKIEALSAEASPNYNQLVRWVVNKEKHAEEIQQIVSQYFLHQRIKLTDSTNMEKYKTYVAQLESLHKILVYSMKAKQGTDAANIANLKSAVEDFEGLYFHKH